MGFDGRLDLNPQQGRTGSNPSWSSEFFQVSNGCNFNTIYVKAIYKSIISWNYVLSVNELSTWTALLPFRDPSTSGDHYLCNPREYVVTNRCCVPW